MGWIISVLLLNININKNSKDQIVCTLNINVIAHNILQNRTVHCTLNKEVSL